MSSSSSGGGGGSSRWVSGPPAARADGSSVFGSAEGDGRAARRMLSLHDETFANPIPRADLLAGTERPAGLKDAERSAVRAAVARARGNMSAAARELGVSRATFYRLLKKHSLNGAGDPLPR